MIVKYTTSSERPVQSDDEPTPIQTQLRMRVCLNFFSRKNDVEMEQ
jgi:hypothetical protein